MAFVTINWQPDAKQLRLFGLSMIVGFGAIGSWMMFHNHEATPAYVCWGIAAVAGLLGLTGLKIALPLYWAWMSIAFILGNIISHVLLGVAYFIVVTGMALIMKLIGRDRLHFKRRQVDTYWQDVPAITGEAPYERQS